MSALAAPRATVPMGVGKVILNELSVPVKANAVIYAGGIVVMQAGYAKAGVTGTGLVAAGILDPVPAVPSVTGGATDGAITSIGSDHVRVSQGVFKFNNSGGGDTIAQANVGALCYIVDDQTVALTDGTGTRSAAGVIIDVDSSGVWVAMGLQLQPSPSLTTANTNISQLQVQVGQGNPEEISASGAVSVTRRTSRFAVSGTKTWTLADGTTPGQRKTLFCVSQASTPVGVITPAHASGFSTITFGVSSANASVELEWDASLGTPAWKVVGVSGTSTIA